MTAGGRSGSPAGAGTTCCRYFLKHEDISSGGEHHGQGGEWRVEHPRIRWEMLDAFTDAAEQAGIPQGARFQRRRQQRRRLFPGQPEPRPPLVAARGFLKPALRRPNLKLETGARPSGS